MGCANTGAVKRNSYLESAALTHASGGGGSGSNGEAKYSRRLIALH